MFNCTVYGTARWVLPRYFDYDIVNGAANTSVEWIRIYVPGPWHPVAVNTLGPTPDDSTTYREWRKVYHFEVYWPREAQAAPIQVLFRNRYLMHPSILGIIETGSPGDTNDWVAHTLALHTIALRGQFSLRAHRTSCMLD